MPSKKRALHAYVVGIFIFTAIVIIAGPIVQWRTPCFFNPLLRIARGLFALCVGIVLPAGACSFFFKRRLGFHTVDALILGLSTSIALVGLAVYWGAQLFGFGATAISGSVLALSVIVWAFAASSEAPPRNEPPLLSNRSQTLAIVILGLVFLAAAAYPFLHIGEISTPEANAPPELYGKFDPDYVLGHPRGAGITIPCIGDWSFIMSSDVAALVSSGVPPRNPFFCAEPLRYYYLYHLYTATFVKLSGGALDVQAASVLALLLTALAVYCTFLMIFRRWLDYFSGALFSLLLCTLVGGFDIIPSIIFKHTFHYWPCNVDHWDQFLYWKLFTSLAQFHLFPQHLCGYLFFFLFFFIYTRYGLRGPTLALCIAYLAASMGFSAFSAIGGFAALVCYVVLTAISLWRRRARRGCWFQFARSACLLAIACLAALCLVGPMYWTAIHGSIETGSIIRRFRLPPLHTALFIPQNYRPHNPAVYLSGLFLLELAELGPVLLFGIAGLLCLSAWKDASARRTVCAMLLGSFLLVHTTEMGGTNLGDVSSKVVGILYWWSLAILAGLSIKERQYLWGRAVSVLHLRGTIKRAAHAAIIACAALSLLLGIATTLFEINCRGNRWTVSIDEYMAFLFIREHLPPQATVQRGPSNPEILLPGWAWRCSPFYNRYSVQEYSVDVTLLREIEQEIHQAFGTPDAALAYDIFRRCGADYLFIGFFEKQLYTGAGIQKFDRSPNYFRKVWSQGEVDIYKILKVQLDHRH